jgi:hypothetical protein
MKLALDSIVWRLLPSVKPGRALADPEWRTLRAAAEALLPNEVAVTSERVADNVEVFLSTGRSRRAWRCRVLLHLLEALAFAKTGRPFSALPIERRRAFASTELAGEHHAAWLCAKVRFLVYLGAYGDRSSHAMTGFVPVHARPRLGVFEASRMGGELA